ncbi:MAG: deoxyribonuclease IV [Oceanidesulfovibrio sp.]
MTRTVSANAGPSSPTTSTGPLLGAHMSVAGGLHKAFERIREVDGTALQIFTRNQRTWRDAPMDDAEVALFRAAWSAWGEFPVASHAAYLINLASTKPEVVEKSTASLGREIHRCARLGVPYVVLHPGAPQEAGAEAGMAAVARGLDAAFAFAARDLETGGEAAHADPMVLLEITAGQGSALGATFAELAAIISSADNRARLGICLDTCHAFATGYDVATPSGLERMVEDMDAAGLSERLGFIHLNDSKSPLGSRKDRHAHIGEGEIGLEGFAGVINHSLLRAVPMVIETPKGENLEFDHKNLGILRELAGIFRGGKSRQTGDAV